MLVTGLALLFSKTKVGRALRAVADDHQAALAVGIPLQRIWAIVWSVAGLVALVAGLLWGARNGVQFALTFIALKALPVLILGGFTSVPGAIVGGLIIGASEKLAEVYLGPHGRRRHRGLVPLRAGPAVPAGAAGRPVRRKNHPEDLMLYREAGQFKTSYQSDNQIFPIRQDRIALFALLAAAFVGVPLFASPYLLSAILIPFLIFALAALGLNILTGYCGQLSLGTAAFMAVGAYAAFNFVARIPGMPLLLAFVLGGLCAALVGMVFGLPSLRVRGFYLAASTLATQFFVVWCLTKIPYLTNYSSSGVVTVQKMQILGYSFETPNSKYLLVLAIVAVPGAAGEEHDPLERGPLLDGGARHGRGGRSDRLSAPAHQAARLCRQLVLLRRGGRPVCVCLPGHGGAGGLQPRPVVPHPLHDHHRRRRLGAGLLPRRRLHRAAARGPEYRGAMAWACPPVLHRIWS